MKSPTAVRVEAIADHMESLGAYTQANEVRELGAERDRLAAALRSIGAACEFTDATRSDLQQALDTIHRLAREAAPRQLSGV